MGGYALWQVVEIELFRMRNAECTRQNGKWILNSTFLILHLERGCSSVGRAVALQAIGQEFESPQLHQPSLAAKQRRWLPRRTPAGRDGDGQLTRWRATARQANFGLMGV